MAPTTGSWASDTASRCRRPSTATARYLPPCAAVRGQARLLAHRQDRRRQCRGHRRHQATRAGCLGEGKLVHSYPHSWRSKAPLIFRNTPQWFISMERNGLRQKALAAIAETRWIPAQGREPHPLDDREPAGLVHLAPARLGRADRRLRRPQDGRAACAIQRCVDRIAEAFEQEGADAWLQRRPSASSAIAIPPITSR